MRFAGFALLAVVAISACHREAKLSADHAWVRLSAVSGNPSVAYLVIHGGPTPERLVAVDSAAAGSGELHESMKVGAAGMTGMKRLDGLDVPAGDVVIFAPGGNHVMLFGLSPGLKAGGTLPISVRFEKGQPLTLQAKIVNAGDAAPY